MFTITGFAEAEQALRDFPGLIDGGVLRQAAAAGATILRDEAIARAPVGETGSLRNALYLKFVDDNSTETRKLYYVSVRRGKKPPKGAELPSNAAYYGLMVEFGHWYVPPKPKGISQRRHRQANIGKKWVPAQPYLRPAYQAKVDAAIEAMRDRLRDRVSEIMEKLSK